VSLIVVGLNHRTVPVGVLERVSVPTSRLSKALHDIAAREHLAEAVVLSTCNRTEVYARCTRFHPAVGDVRDFLAEVSGADPDELSDHLYTYVDDAATTHLFSVAAGLDSMIVGESEILGQVRSAWLAAEHEETAGYLLAGVFRHAVESGKRVRTETQIGRHPVSISSAAVAVAAEHLGGLEGCRVLVIGAGEMADGMAVALANRGVAGICVANRTLGHGEDLAARVGGRAVELDALPGELAQADLVLASTGSSDVIVERGAVETAVEGRTDRPLLIVDVAMPRDIDPGVGAVEGVTLLDIDDLKDFARRSTDRRRAEIGKAREILNEELERYRAARDARQAVPLVVALRERGDEVREHELARFAARFAKLDDAARADIEALAHGIVNKLLHEPTVRLKATAGTDQGAAYADALAALFDLPS
jgi:glutamyl-tRNA reductase